MAGERALVLASGGIVGGRRCLQPGGGRQAPSTLAGAAGLTGAGPSSVLSPR
jgi:hypothetical protein